VLFNGRSEKLNADDGNIILERFAAAKRAQVFKERRAKLFGGAGGSG
jgi:hypothetical protein